MILTNKSSKYFVLVVFAPIIGISLMFFYAYIYVNKEITILENELSGLKTLNVIQDIIFDVQKLRGLSNIKNRDADSDLAIKTTKKDISSKLTALKKYTQSKKKYKNQKKIILEFIDAMDSDMYYDTDFDHLTMEIEYSLLLLKDIAFNSKLMLDSEYQSYILIDTIVSILPELIEYNGQIRGIGSSIKDGTLTQEQKEHIKIQLSKIDEKLDKFQYYMKNVELKQEQECYGRMLSAENSFMQFAKKELLTKESVAINPNDIFKLGTENIRYIINIYNNNSQKLKDILQKRVNEKHRIALLIIFIAFASLMFILYINIQFYNNNKKFIKKIKQLSITDSMTGLFNRREFDTALIKRLRLAKRKKNVFGFIMLDIDFFKNYNDNYGHQYGDRALKSVANVISSSFSRPDDSVFRLGGEEFGVLFSTNNADGAKEMAQKVLSNIENLNIEHGFSDIANHITASIGIGIISYNNIENSDTIYVEVDDALYRAKDAGRNRYEMIRI